MDVSQLDGWSSVLILNDGEQPAVTTESRLLLLVRKQARWCSGCATLASNHPHGEKGQEEASGHTGGVNAQTD